MARAKLSNGIDEVHSAIDSAKDGKKNRMRLICRWCDYGEKWYADDGSKIHQLFYYHFHDGPWAEGATRNREMIKAAQRMAHDIERDPELREPWVARYAAYRATIPEGSTEYYHFFNFVYVSIHRMMREKPRPDGRGTERREGLESDTSRTGRREEVPRPDGRGTERKKEKIYLRMS